MPLPKLSPLNLGLHAALALAAGGLVLPLQAAPMQFDLEAGRIEDVLPEFARQAGIQIIAPAGADGSARGETSGLKGEMDTRQALDQLLDGTGLAVVADDGYTITLRQSGPLLAALDTAAALPLAAVGISATAVAVQDPQLPEPGARAEPQEPASRLDQITVVGSQIKGGASAAILPISTFQAEQIEATGAVSGDELYRQIPQMGDVSFIGTNGGNSSNYARGDIASVNLRGLGVGNTLLLINGRRTVVHPTSQADGNLVPVLTYNANTVPVANLSRVEVLLDGAAAIYGTDAVAVFPSTSRGCDYLPCPRGRNSPRRDRQLYMAGPQPAAS